MKPKDLRISCSFEERYPLFLERFFYMPSCFDRHEEFGFSLFLSFLSDRKPLERKNTIPTFFSSQGLPFGSFVIEYCSGNGQWILEKAKEFPHIQWIAVEMRFDRVRKIWAKMHNLGIKNLWIVFGEAFTFTRFYLPSDFLSAAFINFPDPWPKRRHEKHRLLSKGFVEELARVLEEKSLLTVATDDNALCQSTIELMLDSSQWKMLREKPYYIKELFRFGSSYFEELWRQKGKNIHYLQMQVRKQKEGKE